MAVSIKKSHDAYKALTPEEHTPEKGCEFLLELHEIYLKCLPYITTNTAARQVMYAAGIMIRSMRKESEEFRALYDPYSGRMDLTEEEVLQFADHLGHVDQRPEELFAVVLRPPPVKVHAYFYTQPTVIQNARPGV